MTNRRALADERELRHAVHARERCRTGDPPAGVAEDRALHPREGGEISAADAGPAGRKGETLGEAPALGRDAADVPVRAVLAGVDDELRRLRRAGLVRPVEVEGLELDDLLALRVGQRHLHLAPGRDDRGGVPNGVPDDALGNLDGAPEGGVVVTVGIVPRGVHRPEDVADGVRGGALEPALLAGDPLAVVGRVHGDHERPIDLSGHLDVPVADLRTVVLPDEPERGEEDGGIGAGAGAAGLVVVEAAVQRVVDRADVHDDVAGGEDRGVAGADDIAVRDQPQSGDREDIVCVELSVVGGKSDGGGEDEGRDGHESSCLSTSE